MSQEGALLIRMEGLAREIDDQITRLDDVVNATLRWVPSYAIGLIETALKMWDEMCQKLADATRKMAELLHTPGSPGAMYSARDAWTGMVDDIGKSAGAASNSSIRADDVAWQGRAKNVYVRGLRDQRTALQGLQDRLVEPAARTLGECAGVILEWWAALYAAWVTFKAAVAAGTLQLCSLAGIPTGVLTLSSAGAAASGAAGVAGAHAISRFKDAEQAFKLVANDFAPFSEGGWPILATW